jgi:hypothetical protein
MPSWHSASLVKHRDNFTLPLYAINSAKYDECVIKICNFIIKTKHCP